MVCALLRVSVLSKRSASRLSRSGLLRFNRRWSARSTSGVQCSTGCLQDAAGRSLRRVAGGAARAHCRHQGRQLCLGELPWQLKTANVAVAAPGRAAASRGAAPSSTRMPERTSQSASCLAAAASCLAAAARGILRSSSTSSHERASQEAARRDVLAARASACRLSDEGPHGGDRGLVAVVPRGLRQQCRLAFSCLARGLVIFSSQAVLLRLGQLTR